MKNCGGPLFAFIFMLFLLEFSEVFSSYKVIAIKKPVLNLYVLVLHLHNWFESSIFFISLGLDAIMPWRLILSTVSCHGWSVYSDPVLFPSAVEGITG